MARMALETYVEIALHYPMVYQRVFLDTRYIDRGEPLR